MRKQKVLKQEDIDQILNEKLPIEHWEFQLGVGLQYEYAPEGVRYSAPYPEMGKELWIVLKYELYGIVCKEETKEPNQWVAELISGDIRNLIIGITSAITAKYNVTLGIAIPAAALIIKTGIGKYCSDPAIKPTKSVAEILSRKKNGFKK
jgi:hypothetical protein